MIYVISKRLYRHLNNELFLSHQEIIDYLNSYLNLRYEINDVQIGA